MSESWNITSNGTSHMPGYVYNTSTAPVFVSSGASVNVFQSPPPVPEPTVLDWLAAEIDSICELSR